MRVVIAVLLVLSMGCGRTAGVDESPPPSGDVADAPASGRPPALTASATGIGSVQIGMTVAAAERAIGSGFAPLAESGECVYRRTSSTPAGVLFMQVAERIVRVDVTAPGIRTREGVEVGAPASRVHEVYGDRVSRSPHKYTSGEYLTVNGDAGHSLIFETDGQKVTRYRLGRHPEVEWVEGCS